MAFEKYKPRGLFSEFYGMLRGETGFIILQFWSLSTTTKPFDIISHPIQSTYQGHSTTVFSHKYAEREESLRESIEKLHKRYENESDT